MDESGVMGATKAGGGMGAANSEGTDGCTDS
jgi:hypothetical protein